MTFEMADEQKAAPGSPSNPIPIDWEKQFHMANHRIRILEEELASLKMKYSSAVSAKNECEMRAEVIGELYDKLVSKVVSKNYD